MGGTTCPAGALNPRPLPVPSPHTAPPDEGSIKSQMENAEITILRFNYTEHYHNHPPMLIRSPTGTHTLDYILDTFSDGSSNEHQGRHHARALDISLPKNSPDCHQQVRGEVFNATGTHHLPLGFPCVCPRHVCHSYIDMPSSASGSSSHGSQRCPLQMGPRITSGSCPWAQNPSYTLPGAACRHRLCPTVMSPHYWVEAVCQVVPCVCIAVKLYNRLHPSNIMSPPTAEP